MILRNSLNFIPQFLEKIKKQFRRIYLNSNLYDKKISKVDNNDIIYKPSPHLLSSLIKYQTKKININDIVTENIWEKQNDNIKDFKRLNNFYWFFSLDLKSSKKNTRKIVSDWIRKNFRYNSKSWEFDLTSKRIIAWLSNHSLTIEESDKQYLNQLTITIKKQTNHLINEIKNSKLIDDKIIGCAAIILVGLCYKDKKNYLPFGLQLLKKYQNYLYNLSKSRRSNNYILFEIYFN